MASKIELAKAYVTIIPSMQGSRQALTKEMVPAAAKAGSDAGDAVGDGIEEGAEEGARDAATKVKKEIKEVDSVKAGSDAFAGVAKSAGDAAGDAAKVEGDVKAVDSVKAGGDAFQGLCESAAEAMEGIGDLTGSLTSMLGGLGPVGVGVGAVVGGVAAMGSAIGEQLEATREWETLMGKLNTAFETNGHSAEQASSTYYELVGVLGESDVAVEAANHLAQLCGSQQDLDRWVSIATGTYALFGDSLPIEGLTEAANETAKVGQVTGPVADALNWCSMTADGFKSSLDMSSAANSAFVSALESGLSTEDAMNAALEQCSSESERAALLTDVLAASTDEASEAYQEANADVIAYNKAQDDASTRWNELGKSLMPLATAATVAFNDAAAGVTPILQAGIGAIEWLTSSTGLLAPVFDGASRAMQFASGSIGSIQGSAEAMWSAVQPVMGALSEAFGLLYDVAEPLVMDAVAGAAQLLDGAMAGLSSAVGGLAEAFSTNLNSTLEVAGPLVEEVADFVGNTFRLACETAGRALEVVGKVVGDIASAISERLQPVFDAIRPAFESMTDSVAGGLGPALDSLSVILDGVFAGLDALWQNVLSPLVGFVLDVVIGAAIPALTVAFDAVAAAVEAVSSIVSGLTSIVEGVVAAVTGDWDTAAAKFGEGGDLIGQALDAVIGFFGNLLGNVAGFLGEMIAGAGAWALDMAGKALSAGASFIANVASNLVQLPGKLMGWLAAAISNVVRFASDFVGKALAAGASFVSNIGSNLVQLPGKVWGWLSSVLSNAASFVADFAGKALSAGKQFFDNLVNEIGKLPGRMLDIGGNIVKGIWDGISGSVQWIKDKITGWVGDVLGFIKGLFGIASPSRLMRDEVGRWIPAGIAVGIEANASDVEGAVQDVVASAAASDFSGSYSLTRSVTADVEGLEDLSTIVEQGARALAELRRIRDAIPEGTTGRMRAREIRGVVAAM